MKKQVPIRRTDTEPVQVGGMNDGIKRYYDQNLERTVVKLITGDCYTTAEPREMLVTILGSCISVCMRDPIARVGGMNHFLLPGNTKNKLSKHDPGYSTRFGAYAMEELVNGLIKLGGLKERFEVKIFGGGNVINNSAMIGTKNAKFAKEYLQKEGFTIASEDVGGDYPRRIHYFPDTGKLMMRKLHRKEDMQVAEEEKQYQNKLKVEDTSKEAAELF